MPKPVIGAQLYSVRDHLKTLPAIAESLRKVRDIGYTTVQLSGLAPVDPRELAAVVRDSGLRAASTHTDWKRFRTELDAVIEDHRMWGCAHPAIGGLPGEYLTADGVKRFLDELAPIAARLAKAGMDFSYHNHNHELARYGNRTWLRALYEDGAPSVLKAEIDTYWIQAGGGSPAAWLRFCAGRMPLVHLKDMAVTAKREVRMAEVGEGNLDWPEILRACDEGGAETLFVEQDDCYGKDPFESLAVSYRNLRAMGYK